MSFDMIPIPVVFLGTIAVVVLSVELGYQLGIFAHRRSQDEKESPVGAMMGAVLALTAFMLAFTFGIVSDRYDARKGLVREEANALRTAYLRTEFLPESDRSDAKRYLREYVKTRATAVEAADFNEEVVKTLLSDTTRLQGLLWDMAVANARKDMNSDVAALYIESINDTIELHSLRVALGLQARIPLAMWVMLYGLAIFGMMGVGYQTGIAGSKRSVARPILAISFSMVVTLIALMDRPESRFLRISQQPLIDVGEFMDAASRGSASAPEAASDLQAPAPTEVP